MLKRISASARSAESSERSAESSERSAESSDLAAKESSVLDAKESSVLAAKESSVLAADSSAQVALHQADNSTPSAGAVVAAAPVVAPTIKRAKRQQIALEKKGKILCSSKKNILTNAPRRFS